MILEYTQRAKDELEISFEWYEKQRFGLGFEFLDCVESAIYDILDFPKLYNVYYKNFRRYLIRRFPFSIFYTLEDDKIVIHAIFDNRQDPEKSP